MKRTMRRTIRNSGFYAEEPAYLFEMDTEYTPRHARTEDIIAEISAVLDIMCEALDITAEFIAEVVEKSVRKIAQKIHIRPVNLTVEVIRETSVLARPVSISYAEFLKGAFAK